MVFQMADLVWLNRDQRQLLQENYVIENTSCLSLPNFINEGFKAGGRWQNLKDCLCLCQKVNKKALCLLPPAFP